MEWQTILVILAAVVVAVGGIYFVMPFAIKKGMNVTNIINGTETVLNAVDTAVDGIRLLLPENTALSVVDMIIKYAKQAVDAAEQMYKAQAIEAEARKAEAIKIVDSCLEIAGVERTEEIDKVISGLIEAAVFALPKTNS